MTTNLPKELEGRIKQEAKAWAKSQGLFGIGHYPDAYIAGANAYAEYKQKAEALADVLEEISTFGLYSVDRQNLNHIKGIATTALDQYRGKKE